MAKIYEEIDRIIAAKKGVREAIIGKGVEVPEEALLGEYAGYIDEIQGGSGDWTGFNSLWTAQDGTVHVPEEAFAGMIEIPARMFLGNAKVGSVAIPRAITYIRDQAFNQTKITHLDIPNNVRYVGDEILATYDDTKYTVTVGNGLTGIANNSFQGCIGIDLSNAKNMKTVSGRTFGLFEGDSLMFEYVERFNVSGGVIYMNDYIKNVTFSERLERIQIGSAVNTHEIMCKCPNLESVTFMNKIPPIFAEGSYVIKILHDCSPELKVYVPADAVEDYRTEPHFQHLGEQIVGF